jgi:hypothetical protein
MPLVDIFRFETVRGRGVYRSGIHDAVAFALGYEDYITPGQHPTPLADLDMFTDDPDNPPIPERVADRFVRNCSSYCGFASFDQLVDWFTLPKPMISTKLLSGFEARDMMLAHYVAEPSDVLVLCKQTMFIRGEATLIRHTPKLVQSFLNKAFIQ